MDKADRIITGTGLLCAALLAFNAYLLIDHKGSARTAMAAMEKIYEQNQAAHADMMKDFQCD